MASKDKIWDGRGDRLIDARYSQFAGQAIDDMRFGLLHFRLIGHIGKQNQRRGWLRLSQTELARTWGVSRTRLSSAVNELVEWGYVAKQNQAQTKESFCLYKVVDADDVPEIEPAAEQPSDDGGEGAAGVSRDGNTPPTGECSAQETPVFRQGDTSVPLMDTKRNRLSPTIAVNSPPPPSTSGQSGKGGGGGLRPEKTIEADLIVDGLHEAGVSASTIETLLEPLVRRRRIDAPDPLFALLQIGQWIDGFPEKFPHEALVTAREQLLTVRRVTVKDADISDAVKAAAATALERAAIARRSLPASLATLPAETAAVRDLLRQKIGEAEYEAWNTDLMVEEIAHTDSDTTVRLTVGDQFRARWANQNQAATLIACCAAIIPGTTMVRVGVHNHGKEQGAWR